MPNLYCSVKLFNRVLQDSDAQGIEDVIFFIQAGSRQMDGYTHRHFYDHVRTQVLDGNGGLQLVVPDLISVTTLKTDADGDATYEVTWATTDYYLLPSNSDPATANNPMSKPYYFIEYNPNGSGNFFPRGRQRVEIAGSWGYWRHLRTASETLNEELDTSEVDVDRSADTDIEQGHTILIDSEQMFVKEVSGTVLTVERGVNGTTAATHTSSTAISIYDYPPQLEEAILLQASRLARRSASGGVNEIGIMQGGATAVGSRMDVDVRQLLDPLRLVQVG